MRRQEIFGPKRFSLKGAVIGFGATALSELAILTLSNHISSEITSYQQDWINNNVIGIIPDILRDAAIPFLGGFVGSQFGTVGQNKKIS